MFEVTTTTEKSYPDPQQKYDALNKGNSNQTGQGTRASNQGGSGGTSNPNAGMQQYTPPPYVPPSESGITNQGGALVYPDTHTR